MTEKIYSTDAYARTMVSLLGLYQPPLGRLGEAVDRLVLHRMAESAFERFFKHLLHAIIDDHQRLVAVAVPDEPKAAQLRGWA